MLEERTSAHPSASSARTPSRVSSRAPREPGGVRHRPDEPLHEPLGLTLAHLHPDLGGRDPLRKGGEPLGGGFGGGGEDLEEAGRGVEGVVEPVPAVGEEEVPGHLARERRAGLLEHLLDVGVPGPPHHRTAAPRRDEPAEVPGALDVVDEDRAGAPGQDLFHVEHHEAVRPDDLPPAVHHPEPVAVPVEREAEVGPFLDDGPREVRVTLADAGVGRVVREAAVHLAVQLDDVMAKGAKKPGRGRPGDAVARVDRDPEAPSGGDASGHLPQVVLAGVLRGEEDAASVLDPASHAGAALLAFVPGVREGVAGPAVRFQPFAQPLDALPEQGLPGEGDLESVVVGGVVAARDHDPAPELARREVEDRRWNLSHVHRRDPAREKAVRKRITEPRAGQPAVAPDRDPGIPELTRLAGDGPPDGMDQLRAQGVGRDAAHVVGAKDLGRDPAAAGRGSGFGWGAGCRHGSGRSSAVPPARLPPAGVAESSHPALRLRELLDQIEARAGHGYDHELGDSVPSPDGVGFPPPVPARDPDLVLVVGVDEPHEVPEHDSVTMCEAGTRQDHRRVAGVRDVNREPGPDEAAFRPARWWLDPGCRLAGRDPPIRPSRVWEGERTPPRNPDGGCATVRLAQSSSRWCSRRGRGSRGSRVRS